MPIANQDRRNINFCFYHNCLVVAMKDYQTVLGVFGKSQKDIKCWKLQKDSVSIELRIWKTELYSIFTVSLLCDLEQLTSLSGLCFHPSHPFSPQKKERKRKKERKVDLRRFPKCTNIGMFTNEFCCVARLKSTSICGPLSCPSFSQTKK